MSEATLALQRRIASASGLQTVARTMRAMAASSLRDYQESVRALAEYRGAVEIGLGACLREADPAPWALARSASCAAPVVAIVFGSDQGLVGPFNDVVVEHARRTLHTVQAPLQVRAVGERVAARLADAGLAPAGRYALPASVEGIAPLVGRLQFDSEASGAAPPGTTVIVFHNRPTAAAGYEPVDERLLPLDARWEQRWIDLPWPTRIPPEVIGGRTETLRALIGEYLFISLVQACAETLASENASRLAATERADRNIDELLTALRGRFHRERQGAIDEELFDVTAGFEAIARSTVSAA